MSFIQCHKCKLVLRFPPTSVESTIMMSTSHSINDSQDITHRYWCRGEKDATKKLLLIASLFIEKDIPRLERFVIEVEKVRDNIKSTSCFDEQRVDEDMSRWNFYIMRRLTKSKRKRILN